MLNRKKRNLLKNYLFFKYYMKIIRFYFFKNCFKNNNRLHLNLKYMLSILFTQPLFFSTSKNKLICLLSSHSRSVSQHTHLNRLMLLDQSRNQKLPHFLLYN